MACLVQLSDQFHHVIRVQRRNERDGRGENVCRSLAKRKNHGWVGRRGTRAPAQRTSVEDARSAGGGGGGGGLEDFQLLQLVNFRSTTWFTNVSMNIYTRGWNKRQDNKDAAGADDVRVYV